MPELKGRPRISATTLGVDELTQIINHLTGGAPSAGVAGGRFSALHTKIQHRTEHFFNLPAADPVLPAPYDVGPKYQSDILRRTHVQLKSRQTENAPIVRVEPARQEPKQQALADNYETVRNRIFDLVQERQGSDLVGALFDGLNIHCYGVLHWVMAPDVWKNATIPTAEVVDELPPGEEGKRYRPEPDDDGRYGETDGSVQDRARHSKAKAGAPWDVEVIHPGSVSFIDDRSQANGKALVKISRRVPFLDYTQKLREGDHLYLSLNARDRKIAIYEERDRPPNWSPSGGDVEAWGKDLQVEEIWTRDEYYELVSEASASQWQIVKSFRHPYGMPPFAFAYGNRHNDPDPALAYEPLMEGLYRIKPFYDRDMALAKVIAEMIALPYYYIELADGTPELDDGGKPIFLTRNALTARQLPVGAKISTVPFEMNPAFVEFLAQTTEELKAAAPSTGNAEVSATTQAWSIRLQQAQASVEVAASIRSVARCIRTMHRNMASVESLTADEGGFGEAIVVYGKTRDGVLDRATVIGVEPKDVPTLEIEVEIDAHSAAERISMEQHGLDLLAARAITPRMYQEQYRGEEDATATLVELDAEELWTTQIKPVVMTQELARQFAGFIVMGADGSFVGSGGVPVTSSEVLERNGEHPTNPSLQPTMRALPPLSVPGQQEMAGVPV